MNWGHVEDVTRLRATVVADPYKPRSAGRADWSNQDRITVCGLSFAPSNTTTANDTDRHPVVTGAAFYGDDTSVDVLAGDRLARPDGSLWRVTGDPELWERCDGWPGGIVIPVEKVTETKG